MHLEQVQPAVEGLDQPDAANQVVHRPEAAGSQPAHAVGQFVMNVARGEHRPVLRRPGPLAEPMLNATLAIHELLESTGAHSKCLRACKGSFDR